MRRLTIEVPEPGDEDFSARGFDVVDESGRRARGLGFDEMLGQVIAMTHPRLDGQPQYRMQTHEMWAAEQAASAARFEAHLLSAYPT